MTSERKRKTVPNTSNMVQYCAKEGNRDSPNFVLCEMKMKVGKRRKKGRVREEDLLKTCMHQVI